MMIQRRDSPRAAIAQRIIGDQLHRRDRPFTPAGVWETMETVTRPAKGNSSETSRSSHKMSDAYRSFESIRSPTLCWLKTYPFEYEPVNGDA